jgi:hypothetical protein
LFKAGLANGTLTEVLEGELAEGDIVITGDMRADGGAGSDPNSRPNQQGGANKNRRPPTLF